VKDRHIAHRDDILWFGNLKGGGDLEDQGVDGKLKLEWILGK